LSGRGYCFVAAISRDGPPAAAQNPVITNLPLRPALVGRGDELADIADLLRRERLVTIVGPGGVGKTRLAIASGWRAAVDYPDGVWLIDLAPLPDPALIVGAIATALDLTRDGAELSATLIAAALSESQLLLILDNCEHLVGATAALADALLRGIPGLTLLATSQENLRLDTECVYRLDPLALPPADASDVAAYGAVALFAQRALTADRRFSMSGANAAEVADICRRLDGMPLSLEMAAARVPSLGLDGLRASLDARLHVLSTGMRTLDVRHRTLRNAVEWSVGLLDETERLVFRRLGVFAGSFSLEAAMAVAAAGQVDRWTVAGALAGLVDKSLVTLETPEPARYRLLETLRLYAREMLAASGEWDNLAESHARHLCKVFAPARDAWETTPDPVWRSRYLPEFDNLRSAVEWAYADPERADLAIELTALTGFAWDERGLPEAARGFALRAVTLLDERTPPAFAASILSNAARLQRFSDRGEALRLTERSAALFRQLADELNLAKAAVSVAYLRMRTEGDDAETAAALLAARQVLSASGHRRSLCSTINALGLVAMRQHNVPQAIEAFTSVADLARQINDRRFDYIALSNLALLEFTRGDVQRAIQLGREAVAGSRALLQRDRLPRSLHNLAAYLLAANRLDEARPLAEEALSLLGGQTDAVHQIANLQMWALIAALEGRYLEGARLAGWVDAAYARAGSWRNPWEGESYERLLSLLRARLSEEELNVRAAEAAGWEAGEAMRFALDRIVRAKAGADVSAETGAVAGIRTLDLSLTKDALYP
jgi:predicted ATPase